LFWVAWGLDGAFEVGAEGGHRFYNPPTNPIINIILKTIKLISLPTKQKAIPALITIRPKLNRHTIRQRRQNRRWKNATKPPQQSFLIDVNAVVNGDVVHFAGFGFFNVEGVEEAEAHVAAGGGFDGPFAVGEWWVAGVFVGPFGVVFRGPERALGG